MPKRVSAEVVTDVIPSALPLSSNFFLELPSQRPKKQSPNFLSRISGGHGFWNPGVLECHMSAYGRNTEFLSVNSDLRIKGVK